MASLVGSDGKRLSITIDGVSGYTDWDTDYQIIASDLKAIGIEVKVTDNQPDTVQGDIENGNFDMTIWYETPGPSPYYIYSALFASGNSAPIGETASGNFERWEDSATDALLNEYNSTADLATQTKDMHGIEKIAVEQVPVIFLVNEPYWYEYNTLKYVGWPDTGNLYAEPSPYMYPDAEIGATQPAPVAAQDSAVCRRSTGCMTRRSRHSSPAPLSMISCCCLREGGHACAI